MQGKSGVEPERSALLCNGCGARLIAQGKPLSFKPDEYCILQCACSEYPVVAGIPVLLQGKMFERDCTVNRLVGLIKAGKNDQALIEALTPTGAVPKDSPSYADLLLPSAVGEKLSRRSRSSKLRDWRLEMLRLGDVRATNSTIALLQHYFKFHAAGQPASDYFSYRFGQPKFMSTVALAETMPLGQGPAVDLGCGAGHFSRNILLRNGTEPVYGLDIDFFLLWLANTRIAPEGRFVCTDLEFGIPFETNSIASVLMSNFFQFVHGKQHLAREAERVLQRPHGVIALSTLRHRDYQSSTPNRAISVSDYQRLFRLKNVSLVDQAILSRYLRGVGPDVRKTAELGMLKASPMVSIVVSEDPKVFREYGAMTLLPHCFGSPRINPLYELLPYSQGEKALLHYKLVLPSQEFLQDNAGIAEILPQDVKLCSGDEMNSASNLYALADYPDEY